MGFRPSPVIARLRKEPWQSVFSHKKGCCVVQHPFYGVRLFAEGDVIMVQDQVGDIDLAAGIHVGIGKVGAVVTPGAGHNPEVVGSNPAPATRRKDSVS